jgi:hypothetical protein
MTTEQIHTYAQIGAKARIEEIQAEIATLLAAFPEIAHVHGNGTAAAVVLPLTDAARAAIATHHRPHRRMSATERKRVSRRMKKYWRHRRAEQAAFQD